MTGNKFKAKHIRYVNTLISFIKETKHLSLTYRKLDLNILHICVYSDASFATNKANRSHPRCCDLLADSSRKYHVLAYCKKNCKRIVNSIMTADVFAFLLEFNYEFIIQHNLQVIFNQKEPMMMFTDSKQLFDVITL